jgi:hypothetical protein
MDIAISLYSRNIISLIKLHNIILQSTDGEKVSP